MTDAVTAGVFDEGTGAWEVPPGAFARRQAPMFRAGSPVSTYVAARDGTRLAIDVYLPEPASASAGARKRSGGKRFPTIVMFTPYYRRFALKPEAPARVEAAPGIAQFRDAFVPWGYALVAVDVRGTGASFGWRDGFRSPLERLDGWDVAEWICGQSWSDGRIGSTGISYVGAAADFLAGAGHPAVKAVIPTFSVWDTWSNHMWPGGVPFSVLGPRYGALADAMDLDDRERVGAYAYFSDPHLDGPAPVDSDDHATERDAAVCEHAGNFDMAAFQAEFPFRDSGLAAEPTYTSASISPYAYATWKAYGGVAVMSVSGWMDGIGYTNGAIQRYLWQKHPAKRLVLGPWDHGARVNVSPWRRTKTPTFPLTTEYRRFFDTHVKGQETGLGEEKPVHYFVMGEETWKSADDWPVPGTEMQTLYLGAGGRLGPKRPKSQTARDRYAADYGCGTGGFTRFERCYLNAIDDYYPDWDGRDRRMLCYTAEALAEDTEVTGHPWVELHVTSSARDGTFFVYLEDIQPDGRAVYVTEGLFRALHRKAGANPKTIPATGPTHSFNESDAQPLRPGVPAKLAFELLPTSYLFRKGNRMRIAIACADRDHFGRIPDGRPPLIEVLRHASRPSAVHVPVVARPGGT